MKPLVVEIPMRLSNPMNGQTGNTRLAAIIRTKKRQEQRATVKLAMGAHIRAAGIMPPCRVTVTRIAPRKLDAWDGLPASAKAVVDGVADALGIRDDDPRVVWSIRQRKGAPKQYAVEIVVEERPS